MMENRPLKRHPALHDLSRHHHHGLVIAQRCKRYKETDGPTVRLNLRLDLLEFWHGGGAEHFREEEELLLPVYAKYGDINRPEIVQMLAEHAHIRSMVGHIESSELSTEDDFTRFGTLLDEHIRLEERVVFPMIQETIPPVILESLSEVFTDLTPKSCKSFVRHSDRPTANTPLNTTPQEDSSNENSKG